MALMLVSSVSGPLAALGLRELTNGALAGESQTAVLWGFAIGVLLLCEITMEHYSHLLYFKLADLNSLRLDEELIRLASASAGIEQHERPDYVDRIEVLRNENHVLWGAIRNLVWSGGLAVQMLLTGVLLAQLHPLLLLLPLFALPPLVGGRWANDRSDRTRMAAAEEIRLGRHLLELASSAEAAKEIRIFGLQGELARRQLRLWDNVTLKLWRAEILGTVLRVLGQLLFAIGYVAALYLVVRQEVRGAHNVGNVVLAITLAAQVNQQVATALDLISDLQRVGKAVGRLLWLRETIAKIQPQTVTDLVVPERLRQGISFEGVRFRYPGTERDVLEGVDLDIPAGTTVAIVGENGAGKSTLVKLLCRFYEATEGRILVDGLDLRRLPILEWRERVAAGFQDFVRFELVARESVGVGDLPAIADAEAVAAALDRAHASIVLERLGDGLETQLGKSYEEGAELSGGQWQKVALGRAMMRETPLVLILDEPTSALDAHAEHALFERYAASARAVGTATGAITLFVSHRFSTVRMADLILVIRDGEIAERGSHEELMELGGTYAELFELQAAAYR
jgi:ATP-binding cassette subfamily B protein